MRINKKDLTFKFFEDNPHVLDSECKPGYLEQLGIKEKTYIEHRDEYNSILLLKRASERQPIYIKTTITRQKFLFDDSKLFSKESE